MVNLDEQALLFASDEESIVIGALIALARKEPVGPLPCPPAAPPCPEADALGSAGSARSLLEYPDEVPFPALVCGRGERRPLAERGTQHPDKSCGHGEPVCLSFDN